MIDHFNLPVRNLDRSLGFYTEVLRPLGKRPLMRDADAVGFGADTWEFGLVRIDVHVPCMHLGFRADSREAVDEFFRAAIASGAVSNGAPGIRHAYDSNYYAAYVLDPEGHNIEAVCRT